MHTHRVKWGTQTMGGNVGFYECIHTELNGVHKQWGEMLGFMNAYTQS